MNVSNFYSRDVRKEEKMKGLIKAADGLTAVILTLAAGTMIGAIFLQVFFRFVVQSPLYWTEELSRYSFDFLFTLIFLNCCPVLEFRFKYSGYFKTAFL